MLKPLFFLEVYDFVHGTISNRLYRMNERYTFLNTKKISPLIWLLSIFFVGQAYAIDPVLHFSDLVSGPDTGLGDGLGSGVVVTVWGQHLGSSQGSSDISFIDADGIDGGPVHVYYWKNADGELPGGPANLYESHRMQEIAFSIPDSAIGLGEILVTVNGEASTLPFTVRPGNIYHVKFDGVDEGDGLFAAPWGTVAYAANNVDLAGSTIYVHDVASGCPTCERGVYWNNNSASSSLSEQFAFVAYPNTRPTATGLRGFTNYRVDGQVISKFDIYASNYLTVDSNGQPGDKQGGKTMCFESDRFGRGVGNRCTDIPGGCASGSQGAIVGNALDGNDEVEAYQALGNEVYEYGCQGSDKQHHTTYLSIRSADLNLQLTAWRFGWNYLHDNHTKNGIHQYDENLSGDLCGSPVGTVIINDNVIVNQGGAGISIAANCPWTNDFDVYNNLLINTGLAAAWDGIDPITSDGPNTNAISIADGGLTGVVNIFNNTIIGWNDDDPISDAQACLGMKGSGDTVNVKWNNNICVTEKDKPFVAPGCCGADIQLDNVIGNNNVWYFSGSNPQDAILPTWDGKAIVQDPLINLNGVNVTLEFSSPVINQTNDPVTPPLYDLYGVRRNTTAEIGAVEFFVKPKRPSNLTIK
jgi:hypothetical protein